MAHNRLIQNREMVQFSGDIKVSMMDHEYRQVPLDENLDESPVDVVFGIDSDDEYEEGILGHQGYGVPSNSSIHHGGFQGVLETVVRSLRVCASDVKDASIGYVDDEMVTSFRGIARRYAWLVPLAVVSWLLIVEKKAAKCDIARLVAPTGTEPKIEGPTDVANGKELPKCAQHGTQAVSWLMVFMGHSGSSAILSELIGHSSVYNEEPEPVNHGALANDTQAALAYTRAYFERGAGTARTPGFKIRPTHILTAPDKWAALAAQYDTRIVWNYRRNVFKQAIGEYKLRRYNDTSVIEGLHAPTNARVSRFKVDDLPLLHGIMRNARRVDREIADAVSKIDRGRGCVFEFAYEDYLYNRDVEMRNLHAFLGLAYEDHEPSRYKATSDNLCEAIVNWNTLCENLYGCLAWRAMMDDRRNNCRCKLSYGPDKYCEV